LRINGARIVTTVFVSSVRAIQIEGVDGPTLKDCVLVSSMAAAESIYANAPTDVRLYGSTMANKPKHADVTFLTGGYPAPFTNRVSSVLQVAQREGSRESFRGQATLGFAGAGTILEGPIDDGRGSWVLSLRRSFLDVFTDDIGVGGVPVLYTFNGKAGYDGSARARLWVVNISGVDRIRLGLTDETDLDDVEDLYLYRRLGGLEAARTGRSAEDELMDLFTEAEVKDAIEELPDNFRMAVLLADVEGFSYKEIADILECPVGTVMSRLYRGRRLLKKQLYDYAVAEGIVRREGGDSEDVIELSQYRGQKS